MAETIRESLYHPNTSKNTISSWYKGKNRDQIETLANKYNCKLASNKGKFGGVFIERI